MLRQFCYKVYLPSVQQFVYFEEMSNHEYCNILKFLANSDHAGACEYVEFMLNNKVQQDIKLHRIDKFCALLTMISVCIKSNITLNTKCSHTDKDYTIPVNLMDILNMISNVDYRSDYIDVPAGEVSVRLQFPNKLYIDQDITVYDLISSIHTSEGVHDISEFTQEMKQNLTDQLPGQFITQSTDLIKDYSLMYEDKVYFINKSPYHDSGESPISLSLIDNTFPVFCLTLIRTDLKNIYELSHAMSTHYRFSHEHFLNITPVESQIYQDLMKRDAEQSSEVESPNPLDK